VNLLLDTNIAIWFATNSPKLSRTALDRMDRASSRHISAASIWEMAVKSRKLEIDVAQFANRFVKAGILSLPIMWEHATRFDEIATAQPDPIESQQPNGVRLVVPTQRRLK
jgi:PIN domain nuclease of toxin-antitoxin system